MRNQPYLKEWRLFRGLTGEKAGEILGRDKTQISKLENGKPYKQADLEGLARAYRCSVPDLFDPPLDLAHPETALVQLVRRFKTPAARAQAARLLAALVDDGGAGTQPAADAEAEGDFMLKCAACDVPLKSLPVDSKGNPKFACPSCGEGDTLENIMREIREHVVEQATDKLTAGMQKAARGKKGANVVTRRGAKLGHQPRFILQTKSPRARN